ncbi:MAG: TrmH family RNA methyltransferase [Acidobacteriaceae bacterium]
MPMRTTPETSEFPIITSRQNSRVKQLRAAFSANGRGAARAQSGLVAIEGEHLLLEALRSGLELTAVFAQAGRERLLRKLPLRASSEVVVLNEDVFRSAVATEAPQGVAALLHAPDFGREDLLRSAGETSSAPTPLILVAAGLQDPGNLGTLIRSAEAFGATGVLALPGTVSPWNQKALRSSAGSTFRLPVVPGTMDDLRWLQSMGVRLLAATMDGAPVEHANLKTAIAVLIGNEGAGLPPELLALAHERVAIPCPGPVESLNAAVAGSLLLYEAARQRKNSSGANPG